MKNLILMVLFTITFSNLSAHCQVPCGIYDDASRIVRIHEDIQTIRKSIKKINELSEGQTKAQNMNQLVRWVNTKEEHAQHIQEVILNYFLAQRIKPKEKGEKEYKKYVSLLTSCQKIIFHAMKCKQNTDMSHSETLSKEVNILVENYFDNHGKRHINELMEK